MGSSTMGETIKWGTVLLLLSGLLSACGSTKAEEPEPYHITVMTYDYTGDPMKGEVGAQIIRKVEEYTNTTLEISWVSSMNYSHKLSTLLAYRKDMPHIVVADGKSAGVLYAARSGEVWDLTAYLDDYPHLSQGDPGINDNIRIDGKIYGIYRGRQPGRVGTAYREDWAENLGLPEPESIEDMERMIRAFTFDDPDRNGLQDTYGLVLAKDPFTMDIVMTWFGVPNGWGEREDGRLVPSFYFPEHKEALDWLRGLYRDGCINQDFMVKDMEVMHQDMRNGLAGVMGKYLDEGRRVQDYFDANQIDGKINLIGAIEDRDGVKRVLGTSGHSGFFMITRTARNEEEVRACLNFLDQMNDPEMMMLADFGMEGRHYEYSPDGKLIRNKEEELNVEFSAFNQMLSYSEYLIAPGITLQETPLYDRQWQLFEENKQYCVYNPALPFLEDSNVYITYGGGLEQMLADARVEYVIGAISEEELEQRYNRWRVAGGEQMIMEVNLLYQNR